MSKGALEKLQKKIDATPDLQKEVDAAYQQLAADLTQAHDNYFARVVDVDQHEQGRGLGQDSRQL